MSSPRHSNVERRRERDSCRLALSQHINDDRLGIVVRPSEVRLSPRPLDGYSWKPYPGHENIFALVFAKNLSNHSVGTYRLLSRQVGKTFEAVIGDVSGESAGQTASGSSAELELLQLENVTLSDALEKEVRQRLFVEGENEKLRSNLQAAEVNVMERAAEMRQYQIALSKCLSELDKALPALDDLRKILAEGTAS